jgi:membrane protein DedA with SNARE-associated domain
VITSLLLHKLTYVGMFFLLAGAGIVAPVPEELTLLVAGYFSALGLMDPWKAIPLAICALLIGDSILFFLAKTGSAYAHKIHIHLSERGLDRTWIFSPAHPLRAVFIVRFISGLRMISPIFAGFNGASWSGFIATTLAALVIFVPGLFALAYYFSGDFLPFIATFELVRHVVFWSVVLFVGGSVLAVLSPRLHRYVERLRGRTPE